jgi:5-methylcytosine-specific restriction endonuclease McrA
MDSPFQSLFQELQKVSKKLDVLNQSTVQQAAKIYAYYSPRAKFERWRDSHDGKQWKQTQFTKQKGCCAICHTEIALLGSHIDHIQPIAKAPQLATILSNFQITCPPCNLSKGATIILSDKLPGTA